MKILKILPRGKVPERFLKNKNNEDLNGTQYLETIQSILKESLCNPKKTPGFKDFLKSSELILLIKTIRESINSPDFERHFLNSLESRILEIAMPELNKIVEAYQQKIGDEAEKFPVNKSDKDFDDHIAVIKEQHRLKYMEFLTQTFKRDIKTSEMLKKTSSVFHDKMKDETAKRLFLQRKIDAEKDAQRKKELQQLKKESEERNSQLIEKLKDSEQKITQMAEQSQAQEKKREQEFKAMWEKMESEKKVIQSQLSKMDKNNAKLISEMEVSNQRHAEEMKNLKQQFDEDKDKDKGQNLELILNKLQAQHNQEMECLTKKLEAIQNSRSQPTQQIFVPFPLFLLARGHQWQTHH